MNAATDGDTEESISFVGYCSSICLLRAGHPRPSPRHDPRTTGVCGRRRRRDGGPRSEPRPRWLYWWARAVYVVRGVEDPSCTRIGRRGGTGSVVVLKQYPTHATRLQSTYYSISCSFRSLFEFRIGKQRLDCTNTQTTTLYQSIVLATLSRLSSYLDNFDTIYRSATC